MVHLLKPEDCGQIVLPDMSVLIRQKLVENAKIEQSRANLEWPAGSRKLI